MTCLRISAIHYNLSPISIGNWWPACASAQFILPQQDSKWNTHKSIFEESRLIVLPALPAKWNRWIWWSKCRRYKNPAAPWTKYPGAAGYHIIPYIKLITNSFASFQISSGHSSLNFAFLAPTSNIFIWSHNITPVVSVRSSSSIWNGWFLFVFVIGQTNAKELCLFKMSLLKTIAGLLPLCSCPHWGWKSITMMSPCL